MKRFKFRTSSLLWLTCVSVGVTHTCHGFQRHFVKAKWRLAAAGADAWVGFKFRTSLLLWLTCVSVGVTHVSRISATLCKGKVEISCCWC